MCINVILPLAMGLVLTWSGARAVKEPSRIKPDSITYYFLTGAHYSWRDVQKNVAERRLTERQIRFWSLMQLLSGLLFLLIAVLGVFETL
jgi:hypothetical protein